MFYIILAAAGIMSTLHFYGFNNFLKHFKTPDHKPQKIKTQARTTEPPPVPWYIQEQIERAQLEADAYYILTLKGHTLPGVVKYTSNKELIEIIHSYKYANYKKYKK